MLCIVCLHVLCADCSVQGVYDCDVLLGILYTVHVACIYCWHCVSCAATESDQQTQGEARSLWE